MSISNVKTDNFKRKKLVDIIICILIANFIIGVLGAIVTAGMQASIDNREYKTPQDEIQTYDDIYSVKADTENDRLYVFYQDAAALNVYNLNGEFQWAVAIPREQNGCAEFVYNGDTVSLSWFDEYVFNSKTGEFIKLNEESRYFEVDYEKDIAEAEELGYYFGINDLWQKNGEAVKYIVKKPAYYMFINFFIFWALGFGSGLMIGLIALINRFKGIKATKIDKDCIYLGARVLTGFKKALFTAQVIYAVGLVPMFIWLPDFPSPIMILGIVIAFIILGVISMNMRESRRNYFNEMETAYIGKWSGICILGLAADIIMLLITSFVFG